MVKPLCLGARLNVRHVQRHGVVRQGTPVAVAVVASRVALSRLPGGGHLAVGESPIPERGYDGVVGGGRSIGAGKKEVGRRPNAARRARGPRGPARGSH